MASADWVVVYRGFAPSALDLVESMLRVEGLTPRRLGNAAPAMLGAGEWVVEQLIEVPREHEQAALALIESSRELARDPEFATELEAQALAAAPPAAAARGSAQGPGVKLIVLFGGVLLLLYCWLRLR